MKGRNNSMQALMKQANQMQLKMKKTQEDLAAKEYTASSGGDGVKATANGQNKITKIEINPDVLSAGDREMLQDLVVSAVNEALTQAKKEYDNEMSKITGGLNLGMF